MITGTGRSAVVESAVFRQKYDVIKVRNSYQHTWSAVSKVSARTAPAAPRSPPAPKATVALNDIQVVFTPSLSNESKSSGRVNMARPPSDPRGHPFLGRSHFHVNVDPVQQRAGNAIQVILNLTGRTARFTRHFSVWRQIHRGHQHELRGKRHRAGRPSSMGCRIVSTTLRLNSGSSSIPFI